MDTAPPRCLCRVGPAGARRPCGEPATAEVRTLGFDQWAPACAVHAAHLKRTGMHVRPLEATRG